MAHPRGSQSPLVGRVGTDREHCRSAGAAARSVEVGLGSGPRRDLMVYGTLRTHHQVAMRLTEVLRPAQASHRVVDAVAALAGRIVERRLFAGRATGSASALDLEGRSSERVPPTELSLLDWRGKRVFFTRANEISEAKVSWHAAAARRSLHGVAWLRHCAPLANCPKR